jgi:trimethylamine--corrinoid protein Co-methyltransferase
MAVALAGASCVYGAGMTESGVTFDPVQLVMDDEWIGAIMHFVDGICVTPATLLLGDIARVGQFGDYLSLDSTYAHMREQSQPRLMDRRVYEEWQAVGATDMRTRALARTRELLETHVPPPLDQDVVRQLRAIVADVDAKLGRT